MSPDDLVLGDRDLSGVRFMAVGNGFCNLDAINISMHRGGMVVSYIYVDDFGQRLGEPIHMVEPIKVIPHDIVLVAEGNLNIAISIVDGSANLMRITG